MSYECKFVLKFKLFPSKLFSFNKILPRSGVKKPATILNNVVFHSFGPSKPFILLLLNSKLTLFKAFFDLKLLLIL